MLNPLADLIKHPLNDKKKVGIVRFEFAGGYCY